MLEESRHGPPQSERGQDPRERRSAEVQNVPQPRCSGAEDPPAKESQGDEGESKQKNVAHDGTLSVNRHFREEALSRAWLGSAGRAAGEGREDNRYQGRLLKRGSGRDGLQGGGPRGNQGFPRGKESSDPTPNLTA